MAYEGPEAGMREAERIAVLVELLAQTEFGEQPIFEID